MQVDWSKNSFGVHFWVNMLDNRETEKSQLKMVSVVLYQSSNQYILSNLTGLQL